MPDLKKFTVKPYSAKLIAMVDLFAFMLIILLYLYLSSPTKTELDEVRHKFDLLSRERIEMMAQFNEEQIRNQLLKENNDRLKSKIESLISDNETQRLARAILFQKYYREYDEIRKRAEDKKKQAEAAGNKVDDPTDLILESAMEWAAELAVELSEKERQLAAMLRMMDEKEREVLLSKEAKDDLAGKLTAKEKELADMLLKTSKATTELSEKEQQLAALYRRMDEVNELLSGVGGKFRVAEGSFNAGDFKPLPVDELADPEAARIRINRILDQYNASKEEFPYLFIIGHASQLDRADVDDKSAEARMERNWVYAARRAAAIGRRMIQAMSDRGFTKEQLDKLVIVSTGELDMRSPQAPRSQENAWVEVVFGRDWKLPASAGHSG